MTRNCDIVEFGRLQFETIFLDSKWTLHNHIKMILQCYSKQNPTCWQEIVTKDKAWKVIALNNFFKYTKWTCKITSKWYYNIDRNKIQSNDKKLWSRTKLEKVQFQTIFSNIKHEPCSSSWHSLEIKQNWLKQNAI
jgi:hypothetical protein